MGIAASGAMMTTIRTTTVGIAARSAMRTTMMTGAGGAARKTATTRTIRELPAKHRFSAKPFWSAERDMIGQSRFVRFFLRSFLLFRGSGEAAHEGISLQMLAGVILRLTT